VIWLNPAAALALLALVAPLAIHFFVHRNAPRVAFPTLRFIQPGRLASIQRRALEDTVLLAVRLSVLAMAVAAVAGPFLVTAARRRAWDSRLVRAIVETRDVAPAGATVAAGGVNAATFAVDTISDGVVRAVAWLETQPPGRRELVVRSAFPVGSFSAADMKLVPGNIGVRFERTGTRPPRRTLAAPPVLTAIDGREPIEVRREIVLDGAQSSVRDVEIVQGARFPIEIVVAEAERPVVDAIVRSLLVERIPKVPPMVPPTVPPAVPNVRSVRLVLAGDADATHRAPAFAALRTPWMADAAARTWRSLTERRAIGADVRFAPGERDGRDGRDGKDGKDGEDGEDRLVVTADVHASDPVVPALIRAILDGLTPVIDRANDEILQIDDSQLALWSREPGPAALRDPAMFPEAFPRDDRRWFWATALALLALEAWVRRPRATPLDESVPRSPGEASRVA
jgi:hypothetical protein